MQPVVAIGEILFDKIDSELILGGAPLNLALTAHQVLAAHDGQCIPVSRVGNDKLADIVFEELKSRDVSPEFIQQDLESPTGTAVVTRTATDHHFTITEDVAWDRLTDTKDLAVLAGNCAAVCFGTLGQRNPIAHKTIDSFLQHASSAVKLFDINLRQHYYSQTILSKGLHHADVLKLNEEELPFLAEIFNISTRQDPQSMLASILDQFDLQMIAYTRGAEGTCLITEADFLSAAPPKLAREDPCDSVGSGDACAAGILTGILLNWSLERTLNAANLLGAFVASRSGATPLIPIDILATL